ncbi:uncharacterized protein B0I36DRAFT_364707 [Microdochium trichocladiopsis]|uniref:Six-hairpin glycosidase-like protein n=1 Tax=Microdochium trichocladiopsis TaxID=1682393 RepID=A0A9P9BNA2_9PEZI|nr:uncharacterized protein B0I36DRAFT_364707 [Microdochium trichocladiopsis]KAH7027518.1 hypothetical protein B0I36DRAFT_364707 [Microdochium trichocladiopsis]
MANARWIRRVLASVWCLASLPAVTQTAQGSFIPFFQTQVDGNAPGRITKPDLDGVLTQMLDAVDVMQREYYAPWVGTWPGSIDWTGAVMGTHLSAALRTLTEALARADKTAGGLHNKGKGSFVDWKLRANLVDNYFTQVTSYYFGENAVSIRGQAYDDILWVVLGWLEAVRFVDTHTKLHFSPASTATQTTGPGQHLVGASGGLAEILANQTFFGNVWIPPFAHRARVFWELSTHGWDDEYCAGGMTWNPRLLPYKNAITNELFIAASASMYLYFPGDDNGSPFLNGGGVGKAHGRRHRGYDGSDDDDDEDMPMWPPRDPRHLKAAVDGYRWLAASDFTDKQGLIIDGFHISGYSDPKNNNTACDERNLQIFTYNQGVVLTGARGLWAATGSRAYLEDGHKLIRNVVKATGWDLDKDRPIAAAAAATTTAGIGGGGSGGEDEIRAFRTQGTLPSWHGLGRMGVMEELCDASATCNQDALTFKGIFFHHLATFCEPLFSDSDAASASSASTTTTEHRGRQPHHDEQDFAKTQAMHASACLSYKSWLANNVRAALGTRDDRGRFGMWWTAGLLAPLSASATSSTSSSSSSPPSEAEGIPDGEYDMEDATEQYVGSWPTKLNDGIPRSGSSAGEQDAVPQPVDYRNDGVPWDSIWRSAEDLAAHHHNQRGGTGNHHEGHDLAEASNEDERGQRQGSRVEEEEEDNTRAELKKRGHSRGNTSSSSTTTTTIRDPNSRGAGRTVETQGGGLAVIRAYWSILAQEK